jgi:hypothetical protein
MAFDPTDYIPHGMVAALAGMVGYVFKNHVKEDKERFAQLTDENAALDRKLDQHFLSMSKQLTDIALAVGSRPRDHQ